MVKKNIEPAWFKLRMPAELHAWLKQEAAQNFRSMSAELIACLYGHREKREALQSLNTKQKTKKS